MIPIKTCTSMHYLKKQIAIHVHKHCSRSNALLYAAHCTTPVLRGNSAVQNFEVYIAVRVSKRTVQSNIILYVNAALRVSIRCLHFHMYFIIPNALHVCELYLHLNTLLKAQQSDLTTL